MTGTGLQYSHDCWGGAAAKEVRYLQVCEKQCWMCSLPLGVMGSVTQKLVGARKSTASVGAALRLKFDVYCLAMANCGTLCSTLAIPRGLENGCEFPTMASGSEACRGVF